jgi:hypothetical protein
VERVKGIEPSLDSQPLILNKSSKTDILECPRAARAGLAEKASVTVCHFIPTSSSWLNLVERWFEELSEKAIRRDSFVSVPDLQEAIGRFLEVWNQKPKPFIWTAKVDDIIKKIERARASWKRSSPDALNPDVEGRRQVVRKVIYETLH